MFPVELPTELVILVLSYLPLETISVLKRIDHQWHEFIALNASTVYRSAAWREGWIAHADTMLAELDYPEEELRRKSYYSRRAMRGVRDWKDFCMWIPDYGISSDESYRPPTKDGRAFVGRASTI